MYSRGQTCSKNSVGVEWTESDAHPTLQYRRVISNDPKLQAVQDLWLPYHETTDLEAIWEFFMYCV